MSRCILPCLFTVLYLVANVFIRLSAEPLTGTVTELGTGTPIPNATVTVVQLSSSTTSNASGQYAFGDLPGGTTYTVTATAVGYITETKSVWIPGAANQAPTVSLTSPANGTTYTAPATVNLAATASDSDGTIASVRFYSGTTLLNTATSSPYTYSWTGVGAGSYALRAVAQDNQGATSTSTIANITVNSASSIFPSFQRYQPAGVVRKRYSGAGAGFHSGVLFLLGTWDGHLAGDP